MDTHQLTIDIQSHQPPIVTEATHYYLKMSDAIILATTHDLNQKHQAQILSFDKDHQTQLVSIKEEHQVQLVLLAREHETHCKELEKKYEEQLSEQLKQQQIKHDKAMKSQGSTHASLPLVQTLSRTITEREKEIDALKLQMRGLKKQITDKSDQSPAKIVHLLTPQLSIHPPTPMTVSSIDTPVPVPAVPTPAPVEMEANVTTELVDPPTESIETTEETPAEPEPVYQPPAVTSLTKIKLKGTLYYLAKQPNENGDCLVYECLGSQAGIVVGTKNKDGKYTFQ
jgi:hypothetical protein